VREDEKMLTTEKVEFQQVYETYQPRIYKYLVRLVGVEEAEDLTQEVFLRASHGLSSFRGEAQLSTWLYRIATNAAIDRARSAPYRYISKEVALDEACESRSVEMWGAGERGSLEQILLEKDRFHCYVGYLNRLPLNYKIIVLLTELEELTTREIAEILGLSQETVKIRLHRGRERLFRTLQDHCKPEEWL
jgi:RNA polymerase sigma-70 factor, ECF subfamily